MGRILGQGPWDKDPSCHSHPGTARDKDRDLQLPSFPPCLSWSCQQPNSLDSTLASAALGANFSSKKSSGKTCPGQSLSRLGGGTAEPFLGLHPGMFPLGTAGSRCCSEGGTGWQWESLSQGCLKSSFRMKVRGEPSPCPQFGNVGSRGASGMAGMAPTFPGAVPTTPEGGGASSCCGFAAQAEGMDPCSPSAPVGWSDLERIPGVLGTPGGPAGWGNGLGPSWDRRDKAGPSWEDTDPSQCPLSVPGRGR